jgi:hypothetical protein
VSEIATPTSQPLSYSFLPDDDPTVGCHVATFCLGAAAITLISLSWVSCLPDCFSAGGWLSQSPLRDQKREAESQLTQPAQLLFRSCW